jgi:DNA-binding XRE family transcriptional regulator
MTQEKQENQNRLDMYRRRMKLTPSQIAPLLGHRDAALWSDYESGKHLPSLTNALRLGIILRVPIEFLFYSLHDQLRSAIRAEEERLTKQPRQQSLF